MRILAVAFLLMAACDRPKPLNSPVAPPNVGSVEHPAHAKEAESSPAPLAASTRATPVRPVAAVIAEYTSAGDEQKRRELLWELMDAQPADGVAGVDLMLKTEKRTSLRVELFDALDSFSGCQQSKLGILSRKLGSIRLDGDAFDAALDALMNVQHRDAIPVWKALAERGDDELKGYRANGHSSAGVASEVGSSMTEHTMARVPSKRRAIALFTLDAIERAHHFSPVAKRLKLPAMKFLTDAKTQDRR